MSVHRHDAKGSLTCHWMYSSYWRIAGNDRRDIQNKASYKQDEKDQQMSLGEMETASMDALLANEWAWAKNRQRKYSPEVTHLACLSGISNSEGQKWEQNKKRDCVKSSWEGKTWDSPVLAGTEVLLLVTALWWVASHLITSMKIKLWAIHRGGRAEGWNCVECNQRSCNQKPAPVADIRIHSGSKVRLTYHLCNSLLIFSYNPPVQNKSTSIIYFPLCITLLLKKSFLTGRVTVAVWIFLFIWTVHPVSGIIVCRLDVTPNPKLMKSRTNTKPCFKEQQSALLRGLITPLQNTHSPISQMK